MNTHTSILEAGETETLRSPQYYEVFRQDLVNFMEANCPRELREKVRSLVGSSK